MFCANFPRRCSCCYFTEILLTRQLWTISFVLSELFLATVNSLICSRLQVIVYKDRSLCIRFTQFHSKCLIWFYVVRVKLYFSETDTCFISFEPFKPLFFSQGPLTAEVCCGALEWIMVFLIRWSLLKLKLLRKMETFNIYVCLTTELKP